VTAKEKWAIYAAISVQKARNWGQEEKKEVYIISSGHVMYIPNITRSIHAK
jgi:hypothetical protein